jgi:Uma2 family endonuclease
MSSIVTHKPTGLVDEGEPLRKEWTREECAVPQNSGLWDRQPPEDNPTSEPEPDLIVLAKARREVRTPNPQTKDIRLLVEVSGSTAHCGSNTKPGLYARAELPEYWVIDIPGHRLIVHRDPLKGVYQSIIAYSEKESVRPLAAPDREFRVATAFEE